MERTEILKWDAKMKNGQTIDYGEVTDEYLKRMDLPKVDDISDSLWVEWKDNALHAAEQELKRMADLARVWSSNLFSNQFQSTECLDIPLLNPLQNPF